MVGSTESAMPRNGEVYPISGDTRLTELLERLKMRRGRVAVEINREIVPKANYDATIVRVGDHVEIINFVGGGKNFCRTRNLNRAQQKTSAEQDPSPSLLFLVAAGKEK